MASQMDMAEFMRLSEEQFFREHADDLWYWVSFSEPGKGFLGAVVVKTHGKNHKEALWNAKNRARELGINPGGSFNGEPVRPENIPEDCRNRLLSKEELVRRDLLGKRG